MSREKKIDIMKVWACIFVLVYHVINGISKDGNLSNQYLYYFCKFLSLFHVPAFFFASGYLFSKKCINSKKEYIGFLRNKFINLGIPYIVFSVLYILLTQGLRGDMHTSYDALSILKIFWEPVAQYWYLRTLLLIFIVVPFLLKLCKNYINTSIIVASIYLISVYGDTNDGFFLYCFVFILGGIYSRKKINWDKGFVHLPIAGMISCFIFYCIIYNYYVDKWYKVYIDYIIMILMVNLLYWYCCIYESKKSHNSVLLEKLIPYTLYIYILHTWVTGPIRIILTKCSVNEYIQIIIGTVVGLIITCVIAFVIKKIWILNIWFEPLKTWKKYIENASKLN